MLTVILGLLLVLAVAGNGLQAIYASKLRRELRKAAKEIASWKLATAHWEKEANNW